MIFFILPFHFRSFRTDGVYSNCENEKITIYWIYPPHPGCHRHTTKMTAETWGSKKKSQAKKPSFATITEKGGHTQDAHNISILSCIYIYMYIDVYIYTSTFCHTQYLNMARMAAKAGENHEGYALVRHLLPKIAEEQGWVENEATVERVQEALSGALFLRRQGTSGNSSRWTNFIGVSESAEKNFLFYC